MLDLVRWLALLLLVGCGEAQQQVDAAVVEAPLRCTEPVKLISDEFKAQFDQGVLEFNRASMTLDWDVSRISFEAARDLEPCLPGPWRYLAAIAQAERKYAECRSYAQQALRLNPNTPHGAVLRKLVAECEAQ